MKTKQQVVSEFRRAEILDAARKVFARQGFERGMMDEIAREAGIAKGTVYLYFRSKQEIFRAVLEHNMKVLRQETLSRVDAAPTLHAKIRAFVQARMENAEASKDFFRIMDSEERNLAMTRSQYRDFLREPVAHLTAAIEAASRSGEIRRVAADSVAWMVADAVRGSIQRRLLGANQSSLEEDVAFITEMVWLALTHRGPELK
jgi:AcrR family transcriptional regulator